MIKDNEIIMKRLYDEFSARLCALDIKKVSDYDFKRNEGNSILFCSIATNQQTNISFLTKHHYHQLITDLLMNCELTDILKEASKPYVSEKTFNDIKDAFHMAQTQLKYLWEKDGLYISAPEMFVDIVLFPLSQFHSQIVKALNTFREYVEAAGTSSVFFLNSQSPSFYTQFSDFWVADGIGITQNQINNLLV